MEISSSSTITCAKPFLSLPPAKEWPTPRKFLKVSCSAAKLTCKHENNTNFYKVLSLSHDDKVGIEDIKSAYRNMARLYHPDVCPPSMREESTKKFVRLHAAYKTLLDPILRRKYDYQMGLSDSRLDTEEKLMRGRWQDQIQELKKRCSSTKMQGGTSWASRIRAQNKQ